MLKLEKAANSLISVNLISEKPLSLYPSWKTIRWDFNNCNKKCVSRKDNPSEFEWIKGRISSEKKENSKSIIDKKFLWI